MARLWLGALGLVAGAAQLITAPWSWGIRIAIFGGLVVLALLIAAYQLGLRHGASTPDGAGQQTQAGPASVPGPWSGQALSGRRAVKVASKSENVAICELLANGSLSEQWLPLAPHQAFTPEESRSGVWSYGDEGLHIVVRGYNLLLRPNLTGTWAGFEQYGNRSESFIGAVVNPAPIVPGSSWVGLKLGEHGARRIITAGADGSLKETDPFGKGDGWSGRWWVAADGLHIDVEGKWQLTAEEWNPGILLGVEQSAEADHGFAVVRALVGVSA